VYDDIVQWATDRYMPHDASLVGLGQINRMARIIDLAGAKYLGQREVYRGRPILSCPTMRWQKQPVVRGPIPPVAERRQRRWAYYRFDGHLEITRAETKSEAVDNIAARLGWPPVRDEVFRVTG
jgi:hypothetical protein